MGWDVEAPHEQHEFVHVLQVYSDVTYVDRLFYFILSYFSFRRMRDLLVPRCT